MRSFSRWITATLTRLQAAHAGCKRVAAHASRCLRAHRNRSAPRVFASSFTRRNAVPVDQRRPGSSCGLFLKGRQALNSCGLIHFRTFQIGKRIPHDRRTVTLCRTACATPGFDSGHRVPSAGAPGRPGPAGGASRRAGRTDRRVAHDNGPRHPRGVARSPPSLAIAGVASRALGGQLPTPSVRRAERAGHERSGSVGGNGG